MIKYFLFLILPIIAFSSVIEAENKCDNEKILNELKQIINKEDKIDLKYIRISNIVQKSNDNNFHLCEAKIKVYEKEQNFTYIIVPVNQALHGLSEKTFNKYKNMKLQEQQKYVRIEFYKPVKLN